MKKMAMVVMAVLGLVFFNLTGDVYAGGGSGGGSYEQEIPEELAYVQGGWRCAIRLNILNDELRESSEKINGYLFVKPTEKITYEGGGWMYSASANLYSDKKMVHQIANGFFNLPSYDDKSVWLQLNLDDGRYIYFRLFFTPRMMKGKITGDVYEYNEIGYNVPAEFVDGSAIFRRIF